MVSFSFGVFLRADDVAPPAANTLDAARKDLKSLPETEKSQELLGKSSGLGTASLPALAIPGGSGETQSSKSDSSAPPSATWLQDALNQTNNDRDQHRSGQEAAREREKDGGGAKLKSTSDPLAQYLGKWLTPRDQQLLRPDVQKRIDSTDPLKIPGGSPSASVSGRDRPSSPVLQTDFLPVSSFEPAKNPYLPEPAPQVQPPNPFAPASPIKGLPGNFPAGQVGKPGSVKPAAKPVEAPAVSPNAPTVDDRKYFPQLRRF